MADIHSRVAPTELKAALRMRAEEESRLVLAEANAEAAARAAAKLKEKEEDDLRFAAARAKAAEKTAREAAIQAAAVAEAEENARLAAIAAADELARAEAAEAAATAAAEKAAAEAKQRAEEVARSVAAAEKARAENEARVRAVEDAKIRSAAAAQAAVDAKLKAADEARVAAAAKAREEKLVRARAKREEKLKAAEQARIAALARERAEEEEKAKAEIDALAAEEERIAAATRERAERQARARSENRARATEQTRAAVLARKKILRKARAKLKLLAKAEVWEAKAKADASALNDDKSALAWAVEIAPLDQEKPSELAIPKSDVRPTETLTGNITKRLGICAKRVWFYTCEGDRLGPVEFEELKAMAANSSLDPRRDLVWKKSMKAWMPAGQIEGLFERGSVPAAKRETRSKSKASMAPVKRSSREIPGSDVPWPGARRRSLWFSMVVFPIAWHFGLSAASPFLITQFGEILMGKVLPFAPLVPIVVLVHFILRRLVNLGMSRWWFLAVFAPILNLWVAYRGVACPSGYASHKRLDGLGISLGILYWIAILSAVFFISSSKVPLRAALENSMFPEPFRTAIQSVVASGDKP